jgi:DNA-binding transcriptional MerR regulator
MSIGEAARRSGSSVPTVRYYEEIGLLRAVDRGANGRRVYGWPQVSRLTFIRRSRDLGLSIDEIKTMLEVSDGRTDCGGAREVIVTHLAAVQQRRAELEALEVSLQSMADRCGATCAGEASISCTIFDDVLPAKQ